MVDGQATSADTDSRPFTSGKREQSTAAKVRGRKRAKARRRAALAENGSADLVAGSSTGESARDPSSDKARGGSGVAAGGRVSDDGAARADAARVSNHPNRQTARLKSKLLLQTKRLLRQIKRILSLTEPLLRQTKALLRPTPPSCTSVSTIARLINRRESKLGFEYRVLWAVYHRHNRRYYQRTWEPIQPLLEGGFEEEIALVGRWKDSGVSEFVKLCKQDEFGKHMIGADTSGLCMSKAFVQVAKLAGRRRHCYPEGHRRPR
ncbi:hypothetical protein PInf_009256 [Phytophthora infestans]|nr:hypothetical protein PInf_009256 [Phytophthora infestans]